MLRHDDQGPIILFWLSGPDYQRGWYRSCIIHTRAKFRSFVLTSFFLFGTLLNSFSKSRYMSPPQDLFGLLAMWCHRCVGLSWLFDDNFLDLDQPPSADHIDVQDPCDLTNLDADDHFHDVQCLWQEKESRAVNWQWYIFNILASKVLIGLPQLIPGPKRKLFWWSPSCS